MKTWEEIRLLRTDMSQYVMHCTKARRDDRGLILASPELVLREILQDGFLRATFAMPKGPFGSSGKPTVRGPYPAVCYTEQPLRFFLQTLNATPGDRYSGFAIAIRKDDLFSYGGRPAIYDDDSILGRPLFAEGTPEQAVVYEGGLAPDQQYRWVGYDPTALWDRAYPVDWTHEREWRARPDARLNREADLGQCASEVVPLQLPTGRSCPDDESRFLVLVDTDKRRVELLEWIETTAPAIAGKGGYWTKYSNALQHCRSQYRVLSFEAIKAALDASQGLLGRLEDYYPVS